ncbi:MAG: AraC family transcriptional regulator ligand-binding domain-containing protein [Pseudomonadota bacterium]
MKGGQRKFIVDVGWRALLEKLGLSAELLLRQARLPADLFSRNAPALTAPEYYRLWAAMIAQADDVAFPLRVATAFSVESFSPPLFACFCSPDLGVALERLSAYKPLVGPMRLELDRDAWRTRVTIAGLPDELEPPPDLIATELVFLVHLARLATRTEVRPRRVVAGLPVACADALAGWFGVDLETGGESAIEFEAADVERPFVSANPAMWSIFEPSLRQRLAELEQDAGMAERVRACLIESIAAGDASVGAVATRLAISPRTLQRRLTEAGSSFQQILGEVREELARHYLETTRLSSGEISFLLGYRDVNSFIRACRGWTGRTPEALRAAVRPH